MNKSYGKNAVVGQSGGPTAAINASLAGVISACLESTDVGKLYGMANGIDGMINKRLYDLTELFLGKSDDLSLLTHTPGAALGSCRFKLPSAESDPDFYTSLFSLFEEYGIGYFFYIGGNDSMDTVAKISSYARENGIDIKVVGIPKTIDNDLCGTDHTPGFGSAAKFVSTVFSELRRDIAVYTQKCVTIVEVMGRDAGWLTASSALARTARSEGPDLIYLPELPFSCESCFEEIERAWQTHPDVLIAVSEGVRLSNGTYLGADSEKTDKFGHVALSGAAKVLEKRVKERFGCKVRSIELNTPQRCGSHIASHTDITEAFEVARFAVRCAKNGESGIMAAIARISDEPYETRYESLDVSDIANKVRSVPREYINAKGNGITEAGIRYLRPLIVGEYPVRYLDGVPCHYVFDRI